ARPARTVVDMRPLLLALAAVLTLAGCSATDEAEPAPAPAPARTTGSPAAAPTQFDQYVALGDSYTAAPLVPPTDTSTICLRSGVNYPALLAEAMPGTELTDVSCSGASTGNTVRPQAGRTGSVPPQFDALRPGTDLVTIGLGGNDQQLFGGTLGSCVRLAPEDPTGSPCTDEASRRELAQTLETIRGNIATVVEGVQERSPRARVLVVGYPQIIPGTGTCDDLPIAAGDYPFARELNQGLNEAVQAGADDAGVEFVDLWAPSEGHDVCADEPWINGRVTSAQTALAYHPLETGTRAVAALLLETLS
ncbi:MAG: SGNH/GDSL hydrolase family protein, partial [Nocardioides sp.]